MDPRSSRPRSDSGRIPSTISSLRRRRTCSGASAIRWPPNSSVAPSSRASTRFIAGRAHERRDEEVRRLPVERLRRVDLLDPAGPHHRDPVAQRHRLDLVVRDVDRRRAANARAGSRARRASRPGASRRDSRAARPSGTPPAHGRSRGPSRRAAAARPRAPPAAGRATPPAAAAARPARRAPPSPASPRRRTLRP